MSYIALARKWRPKNFSELVGQSHVLQALSNALDQGRLHHAYLFTGTRGVGKTTIARIFAKALNCEQGISSTPCGQCSVCRSVDEGRFVDLIEVDAASRTKVEDTREILDNVQYAPTQGRYKVYLIDEVHMLSKSSFNALLKTLEEPPEHVKFLLATTDPHKLPVTVLSRCLQFNLMRLTPQQIQQHLAFILQQEQIPFEEAALAMIAKSADGSARDSLSLLDQAIAYGGGEVRAEAVQAMLGLVSQDFIVQVLQVLADASPNEVMALMQQLALQGTNYETLLAELIEAFYELSRYQALGRFTSPESEHLAPFSEPFSPAQLQMLYQMALLAQKEMQWVPDARIGFEMALLRMVAFELDSPSAPPQSNKVTAETQTPQKVENFSKIPSPAPSVESEVGQRSEGVEQTGASKQAKSSLPGSPAMNILQKFKQGAVQETVSAEVPSTEEIAEQQPAQVTTENPSSIPEFSLMTPQEGVPSEGKFEQRESVASVSSPLSTEQWQQLIQAMRLDGMAAELARHCVLCQWDEANKQAVLAVHPDELQAKTPKAESLLVNAIHAYLGEGAQVQFIAWSVENEGEQTPAQRQQQQQADRQAAAKAAFLNDPFVQQFQQQFSAKVIESSIQPK